jgi:hypothetical protein
MIHCRHHKSPSLVRIISHMNPVRTCQPYFHKIHVNITLPSTPRSLRVVSSPRVSNQNFVRISHLLHPCYKPHPSHPPWFEHPNNIRRRLQIMELLIMQLSPPSCHFVLLRSRYSPKHCVLSVLNITQSTFQDLAVLPHVSDRYSLYLTSKNYLFCFKVSGGDWNRTLGLLNLKLMIG